jgi:hypothetical protein
VLGGDRGTVQARVQRLTGAEPYQGTVATSIGYCTPPEAKPSPGSYLSNNDDDLAYWDEISPQGARWIGVWRIDCLYCLYGALSSERHHSPRGAACEPLAGCTRAMPSDRTTSAARSIMCGRLSRYDALLERLPHHLQYRASALGPCIQKEHAIVGQRHVARPGDVAPADQPRIRDGMVGSTTWAGCD